MQPVGGETLVYDERRHRAFCLNRSSSVMWRLADGTRSVEEIRVAAEAELGAAVSAELVRFALGELQREGLVEWSTALAREPEVSRRAMLQRMGASAAVLLPAIAAILAPTAAQAYSGCVDCSATQSAQAARARSLARSQSQQLSQPDFLAPLTPEPANVAPGQVRRRGGRLPYGAPEEPEP